MEKAIISGTLLRPIPGMSWLDSQALLTWPCRISIPSFRNMDWWIRLNMEYAAGITDEFHSCIKQDFQDVAGSEWVNLMSADQVFRLPVRLEKAAAPVPVIAGPRE